MRLIYIAFASTIALSSCGDTKTSDTAATTQAVPSAPPQTNLGEEGTNAVLSTVGNYYELKDALVATKAPKVAETAVNLERMAKDMRETLFASDSTHSRDMIKPYVDTIVAQAAKIAAINDPSCEQQRIAFEPLTRALYELLKKVETKNAKIYHQYCPMAFNDKGAYWLSSVTDIKNPYFGKKMLECGEVTDSM
ncbi:MAG: DUF3347 domain-containing protein [Bacteroidota bacterium]